MVVANLLISTNYEGKNWQMTIIARVHKWKINIFVSDN